MIVRFRRGVALASAVLLSATSCSREGTSDGAPATAPEVVGATASPVGVPHTELGDCLSSDNAGDIVSKMHKVDCAAPHLSEAYHVFNLPAGEFPGEAAIYEAADEGCKAAFKIFVGKEYRDSELELLTVTPQEEGWKERDDREVICLVLAAGDAPRTGSARGLNL